MKILIGICFDSVKITLVIHMFFCRILLHEPACPHQAVECTSITPVAFENGILHHALFKIGIVHIGNLKLTTF